MKLSLLTAAALSSVLLIAAGPQDDPELQRLRRALADCQLKVSEADRKLAEAREIEARVGDGERLLRELRNLQRQLGEATSEATRLRAANAQLQRQLQQSQAMVRQLEQRARGSSGGAAPSTPAAGASGGVKFLEQTRAVGTISELKQGSVIQTASGSVYEVQSIVFEYPYSVMPEVLVFNHQGTLRLWLKGRTKPLDVARISGPPIGPGTDAIESRIDGQFDGFENGRIFKLQNGQLWEQQSFDIKVAVRISPKVLIWQQGGSWRMRVENEDRLVRVVRLK